MERHFISLTGKDDFDKNSKVVTSTENYFKIHFISGWPKYTIVFKLLLVVC